MNQFETNSLIARTIFGIEAQFDKSLGCWYLKDREGNKIGRGQIDGPSCWTEDQVPNYFNDAYQTVKLLQKIAEIRSVIPEFIYLKEQNIWLYPNIGLNQQVQVLTASSFEEALVGFVKQMYKL